MLKKFPQKAQKKLFFQRKITILFFSLIGVIAVSFISSFLYFQVLGAKAFEDFLPSQNLIFLADLSRKDTEKFFNDHPVVRDQIVEPALKTYLNQNFAQFQNLTQDWLGNKMALAVYRSGLEPQKYIYYAVLESLNDQQALDFLRNLGVKGETLQTEDYGKFKLISFSQSLPLSCTFFYSYFVCSNEKDALKSLLDLKSVEDNAIFLSGSLDYQKVKINLPKIHFGRIYADLKNLDFQMLEFYLGPLRDFLQTGGLTFYQDGGALKINTYVSLKKGLTATGATALNKGLATFTPAQNLAFYLSGDNLTRSFQQIFQVWDQFAPSFSLVAEGLVRTQLQTWFGSEVTLENEIYPLLASAYAVTATYDPQTNVPQTTVILQSQNTEQMLKLKMIIFKLQQGFYRQAGRFMPKIKETVLPDGSIVKEIVADQSQVKQRKIEKMGTKINVVEINGLPFSFATAVTADKILISSSVAALQKSLNLAQRPQDSLSQNKRYQAIQQALFLQGEETSFADLAQVKKLLEFLGIKTQPLAWLNLFDYSSAATKWFDDGMASEMVLEKE